MTSCCSPPDPVPWEPCPTPAPAPCPGADPALPAGHEETGQYDPDHPAALCPGPPGVPCPHVPDKGPGPGRALPPCPERPALDTAYRIGHQRRGARDMTTDGVLAKVKYETLPDHLSHLPFSEIIASERFKSTMSASYTAKSRDLCLNPEPIFSPAPPSQSVTYLKEMEERVRQSTLPASQPRHTEYREAYNPRRLSDADMVGRVKLKKPCGLIPSTDVLSKHFYTATNGVAGEVNPYISTTKKDFQHRFAEADKYRGKPPIPSPYLHLHHAFTNDEIIPPESELQPRWHAFTPTVPNTGLQTESQSRYCPPRLDANSRHNWTLPVSTPLVVPPTTREMQGETPFDQESENYGTGRHNPVTLSCQGLETRQRHRRQLCNLTFEPLPPGRPPCRPTGPLAMRGAVDAAESGQKPISEKHGIQDNHYGLVTNPPPRQKVDVN